MAAKIVALVTARGAGATSNRQVIERAGGPAAAGARPGFVREMS